MNFIKVNKSIDRLGSYDDPTFNLVFTTNENAKSIISNAIEIPINVFRAEIYQVHKNQWFYCLDTSHSSNRLIAHAIAERLTTNGQHPKVASFRHNCIVAPSKTLDWCRNLLEEAVENEVHNVLINDFKDSENWQGIDKYLRLAI